MKGDQLELRNNYSASALALNITDYINFTYSVAEYPNVEMKVFNDSMLVPIQGNTFNVQSCNYATNMVKYYLGERNASLSGIDHALNYVMIIPDTIINGAQKFRISTIFFQGALVAPPAYVFPDTIYPFLGGDNLPNIELLIFDSYRSNKSLHYHLEKAINYKYGINSISYKKYLSNFEFKGVSVPEIGFTKYDYIQYAFPGINPNFNIATCMTDFKRANYPEVWLMNYKDPFWGFLDSNDEPYWAEFATKINKTDILWYYNKANTWFNQTLKPAGKVFVNCEMFGFKYVYCLCGTFDAPGESYDWSNAMQQSSPLQPLCDGKDYYITLPIPNTGGRYPRALEHSYFSFYYGVYANINERKDDPSPIPQIPLPTY